MRMVCLLMLSFILIGNAGAQTSADTTAVYFPFDKYSLTPEAKKDLDKFITSYRNGRTEQLAIHGYCDVLGPHPYNDRLSERRTLAVKNYLQQHGVPGSSIAVRKGYGKRMPVNENRTIEERQENRRVDIIFSGSGSVSETPERPVQPTQDFSKTRIDSVREGETLRLRNINFIGGRHTFLPQAAEPLQELLDVMKKYPTLVIEIQGHICCFDNPTGDGLDYDANDMNLSLNRARAVYDFLLQNGIAADRMTYKGFSRRHPIVDPEITEEDRTTNRRVEIKIIRK